MKNEHSKRGGMSVKSHIAFRAAVVAALTLGAVSASRAQSDEPLQQPVARSEIGHSAHAWLALQSSNSEAAPAVPMLGAEAGLAYRRYLDSFNSKIPDLYESALSKSGSGSQSGSGAGLSSGSH